MELKDLREDMYVLMRRVSNKTSEKKPTSNLPGIRPVANRDYQQGDHREMTDQRYREGADRYAAELYQKFISSPNEMKHRSDDSRVYLNPVFEQLKKPTGGMDKQDRYEGHQNGYHDRNSPKFREKGF